MPQDPIEHLRHSLAHLLGAAVLELYPGSKLAIGPSIDGGFYYDIDVAGKISDADLPRIEAEMRKILKTWDKFEGREVDADEARKFFKGNPYKEELISELENKGEKITLYTSGSFTDLCRGGHVASAKDINPEAFKLSHVAGAYWRGDEKNPQLTRAYGFAFVTKRELDDHITMLEEAKKRDHRKLGQQLELFTTIEEVGPGLPFWLPKGTILKEVLESFAKEIEAKEGYQRISTPHIAKENIFKTSGHLPYYADDMYPPMASEEGNYYLKPMNCPFSHMVYGYKKRSYRELPVRFAEFGTVYRYEKSGELLGLLRVRGMTQNDAHIYCTEEQAVDELVKIINLHSFYYKIFGIKDYYIELALPDFKNQKNKYFDNPSGWENAIKILKEAAKKSGIEYVENEGGAAFYGPKFDFNIKSAIGKEYGASTNQLDFGSGQRFGLNYVDKDGSDKTIPYTIHRAPLGSDERFIGFLIEHFAGAFPVWLSPVQAAVLPITEKQNKWAENVRDKLKEAGIRTEVDLDNETLGKKIRQAELQKVPYVLVVGEKEVKAKAVAVRQRGKGDVGQIKIEEFIEKITKEIESKRP
ncbi:MAG TPA: threonine--tRNA ligase [Candidatus Paceibacterota bacterium]|nr:threonine--tRNA ligase [Candidatus Paceibacterota bacterium]